MHTSKRCVALAREVDHAPSIGFALTARAGSWCLHGDPRGTVTAAEEALHFAREERLEFYEPISTVYRGWGLSESGDPEESVVQIRGAIDRYRAAGNGIQQVWMEVILAGAQWKAGRFDDAFATLARAVTLAKKNGEGLFEPELYRLQGEFLYEQAMGTAGLSKAGSRDRATNLADAERSIRESLDLAGRQEARMLQLRSLVSLCRVRAARGSVSQEYEALAQAYSAFTEGFETPDLLKARDMLEALQV